MRLSWPDPGAAAATAALIALLASPAIARQASPQEPSYEEGRVTKGGSVSGVVRLPGPPPKVPDIKVTKDQSVCGVRIPGERIVRAADGGLKNAVVSIEGITKGKPINRSATARLDVQRCRYEPHVLALAVEQKLEMTNSDPILHNPHAKLDGVLSMFNIALPHQNQKVPRVIREPGLLKVTCDAGHIWALAYVHVFAHPYFAVTGEDGRFKIDEIPPGTYRLKAWQEELGTQAHDVTITEGRESVVTFDDLSAK